MSSGSGIGPTASPAAVPKIMGVLNVTPDSFSDGGRYFDVAAALDHAQQMLKDGASLVDIGGESTRPGSKPLTADEEWRRIGEIVGHLADRAPVSLDTYHSSTAEHGLERGVACINDVSAGRGDSRMIPCVAASEALYVMTFSKDSPLPHASDRPAVYDDVVGHLADFFRARVDACLKAGFTTDRLIVDPGLGRFVSLNPEHCWTILADIEWLIERMRPVPLMVGPSRKGFLGGSLAERDPISQYVSVVIAARGARYIRTHNVAMARQFIEAGQRLGEFSAG